MRTVELLARVCRLAPGSSMDFAVHGAEVGVDRGHNAQGLLWALPGLRLELVDPYRVHEPGGRYHREGGGRMALRTDEQWRAAFREADRRVRFATRRYRWHKVDSVAAAHRFEPASLDFVFIDADHSREAVAEDVATWLYKVRPGGWLGGHDLNNPDYPGVWQALVDSGLDFETGPGRTWWFKRCVV